jgi:dipeptidyl aminopeptidase/acylaminoacyl peptidase
VCALGETKMGLWGHVRIAAVLGFCFCSGASGDSRKNEPLPVESVLSRQAFCEMFPMQLSPEGTRLAYAVHTRRPTLPPGIDRFQETGIPWFGLECDVFVRDLASGKTINVTSGTGSNWLPRWSPDGRYLAFLSDRTQTERATLWLWDSRSDVLRMASNARIRMLGWEHPQWMPDSRSILVTAVPGEAGRSVESPQTSVRKPTDKGRGVTVSVYRSGGQTTDGERTLDAGIVGMAWTSQDLLLVNVESGANTVLLHGTPIRSFLVSPDGSRVICASPQKFASAASLQIKDDLLSVPLDGGPALVVAAGVGLVFTGAFSISPQGHFLAYYGHDVGRATVHILVLEKSGRDMFASFEVDSAAPQARDSIIPLWSNDEHSVYVVHAGMLWKIDAESGLAEKIGGVPGRAIVSLVSGGNGGLALGPDKRSVVAMTYDNERKRNGFYAVDLPSGSSRILREVDEGYQFVTAFEGEAASCASNAQRIAYIGENAQTPPDVWTADTDFVRVERSTEINPVLSKYRMGSIQGISWLGDDGQKLDGALLLPSGYQNGQKYPLVVFVYGGSLQSNYMNQFGGTVIPYDNIQLLATRGYAVLMPDAPQREGTPMLDLAKTVLGGVNKAIELGVADPDRIGVFGSSYGGYCVLSLLVQTNRFKVAVETSGFADIPGAYGQMNEDGSAFGLLAEHGQMLMGGTLWEFRERYIENSPLFYLDRVETPLLILHGEKDNGVAVFLADQLFVSLRRLGKEVEYGRYAGEGHGFLGLANQEDAANRMIAWFDSHLRRKRHANTE